jgi:hypothetical protein
MGPGGLSGAPGGKGDDPGQAGGSDGDGSDGPNMGGDGSDFSECPVKWTSDAWANGNARELEEEALDPDDPGLFFSHAGQGAAAEIDGEGNLRLDGNRSRVYLMTPNQNSVIEFDAIVTDDNLENISVALRCNHDGEGTFGKYGASFNFADQEVDAKVEYYHNDHSSSFSAEFPQELERGVKNSFRVALQNAQDGAREVRQRAWVKFAGDAEWTLLLDDTWTEENWGEPEEDLGSDEWDDYKDGPYMPQARRMWLRVNGGDSETEGTTFSNVSIRECDEG